MSFQTQNSNLFVWKAKYEFLKKILATLFPTMEVNGAVKLKN